MTRVRVMVWRKEGVLDPEGRAIARALGSLGFEGVGAVSAGRVFDVDLETADRTAAEAAARAMADRLLANGVIERFTVEAVS